MYKAQNFNELLGLPGFSNELLEDHFTLYKGYVENANKLTDLLKNVKTGTPAHSEVRRRFGWEFNGMRLHELYFGNLVKGSAELSNSDLKKQVMTDFGSVDNWLSDLRVVAGMRGIGWAVTAYDPFQSKLSNLWINEHDVGHLAGATPILVIDVFEHAYIRDYGIKRDGYLDSVFAAIAWDVIEARFVRS